MSVKGFFDICKESCACSLRMKSGDVYTQPAGTRQGTPEPTVGGSLGIRPGSHRSRKPARTESRAQNIKTQAVDSEIDLKFCPPIKVRQKGFVLSGDRPRGPDSTTFVEASAPHGRIAAYSWVRGSAVGRSARPVGRSEAMRPSVSQSRPERHRSTGRLNDNGQRTTDQGERLLMFQPAYLLQLSISMKSENYPDAGDVVLKPVRVVHRDARQVLPEFKPNSEMPLGNHVDAGSEVPGKLFIAGRRRT